MKLAAPTQDVSQGVYFFKNSKSSALLLFNHDKRVEEKGYVPLTFRGITLFAAQYKNELLKDPNQAHAVSEGLQQMIGRKTVNEKKRNVLVRGIQRICDIARNLFSGYGFKTTLRLATEISQELAKTLPYPQKGVISPAAVSKPSQTPRLSEPNKAPRLYWFTPKAISNIDPLKTKQIKKYKKAVAKNTPHDQYPRNFIMEIFNNIHHARPDEHKDRANHILDKNNLTVFVYLLQHITGSDQPDLTHKVVRQLIVDTFRLGNEHLYGRIADWLITQPQCDVELLKGCFDAFLFKFSRLSKNYYPPATLMELYLDRLEQDERNAKRVPLSTPEVVNLMTLMLTNFCNVSGIIGLTQRIAERKDLDCHTFCKLLDVFKVKDETKSTGSAIHYEPRDILLKCYSKHPEWKQELKVHDPQLLAYIQRFGY